MKDYILVVALNEKFWCCLNFKLDGNWTYVKKVDTYATDLSVNFFAKRAGER